MDVSGGAGRGNGGGGSGGRIAVYTNTTSGFYGSYNILGGSATDDQVKPRGGGSGTAYLWEPKNGLPYDMLLIDNNNRLHSSLSCLTKEGMRMSLTRSIFLGSPLFTSMHQCQQSLDPQGGR